MRLRQDHQELENLLRALALAAEAPDPAPLTAAWSELEKRLICHMAAEERYLLPLLEASHPAEVKRTLLEHIQIRDRIAELGVAVELHTVRSSDIQRLIELLRAHSQHEDAGLYSLAGDKASVAVEHSVLATLRSVAHAAWTGARSGASNPNSELPRDH